MIDDSDDENTGSFNDIVDNLSLKENVDDVAHIHDLDGVNCVVSYEQKLSMPDISSLIYDEEEIVIPYLHAGGKQIDNQLNLLHGASSLF